MKIHELIYAIEEMENSIVDYPEEYSYEQHILPLKLKLANKVIELYYAFNEENEKKTF